MPKRQRESQSDSESVHKRRMISTEFLRECQQNFTADPANTLARNAVNAIGSMFSTMNSERVNQISHVFLNTVKKKHLPATNQGASGRCWMFAALNTFRHVLINVLRLENFEFSEVYLFFFDKLERSNTYLKWFIDHLHSTPGQRAYDYMIGDYMNDGGWWNTFANLVNKYGLVPASAMKETAQSGDSDEMNKIIKKQLDGCVNHIRLNRDRMTVEQLQDLRRETVREIYSTLVKFLGQPPEKFTWSYLTDDEDSGAVTRLTPTKFRDIVMPDMDLNNDFIVLAHIPIPDIKYYQPYRILYTNNVEEGQCCTVVNVPVDELAKYAMKSISNGLAVWFVGDVHQSFNWYHSALDDKLDDSKTVFPAPFKFDKGDRILLRNVQGNHAMALTGFNLNERGHPISWQVENSWGYWDYETPGLDGFLYMSQSWFNQYVTQIVVAKKFLSRSMKKCLARPVIELNPWDCMAPALRAGMSPPRQYERTRPKKN